MKQQILVLIMALAAPLLCRADANATTPRSPADMTVEERMVMMKNASKYDNCVYSQAISRVGDFADIRQTADVAMSACQDQLGVLETSITSMGFGADFANAFTKRIRNRAARKILPELAIRKSGG